MAAKLCPRCYQPNDRKCFIILLDGVDLLQYGVRHGLVDNGARDPDKHMQWLWDLQYFMTLGGLTFPWGLPLLLLRYGSIFSGAMKFVDRLDKQAEEKFDNGTVKETALDDGRPVTFFEKVLKARNANAEDFEKYHIGSSTNANMLAGSDTTSIALSSIMYHSLKSTHVWKRLREELNEAISNGSVTQPITFEQAQNLHYFQCVLKEALRVHPSIGLPMWRLIPQGGMEIGGTFFPESVRYKPSPGKCSVANVSTVDLDWNQPMGSTSQ